MLDISMLIESNLNISDIWILSIKNECKEVFIKCDMTSDVKNIVKVHAVDFITYDTKIVFEYVQYTIYNRNDIIFHLFNSPNR